MAIALQTQPIVATAKLEAADVAAVKAALTPLLTLPASESSLADAVAVAINVQPDGSGVLNIRFSK
jgi:hypothetical protein